jgi:hypothetical protein
MNKGDETTAEKQSVEKDYKYLCDGNEHEGLIWRKVDVDGDAEQTKCLEC